MNKLLVLVFIGLLAYGKKFIKGIKTYFQNLYLSF